MQRSFVTLNNFSGEAPDVLRGAADEVPEASC